MLERELRRDTSLRKADANGSALGSLDETSVFASHDQSTDRRGNGAAASANGESQAAVTGALRLCPCWPLWRLCFRLRLRTPDACGAAQMIITIPSCVLVSARPLQLQVCRRDCILSHLQSAVQRPRGHGKTGTHMTAMRPKARPRLKV